MSPKLHKIVLSLLLIMALTDIYAQTAVPQGVNYQSVARNSAGQILTNQTISLRLTIHDTTSTGAIVYKEQHTVQTNAFGTFSVVVGGGIVLQGTFNSINWGIGDKYLQVEMDFNGGSNYTSMGVSQLISVPYALYSGGSIGDISSVKYDTTGITNIYTKGGTIIAGNKGGWLTGGNSGLSSTNNYIGTIDNTDMIIKRGGKEATRFTTGGAMLVTGDTTLGVTPASGAGKRMMWIPAKGAFRAGTVTGTQWDNSNIGYGSVAIGSDAIASGSGAVAIGNGAKATGTNSQAIGNNVIAKAANSMVIGSYNDTTASGTGSSSSDVLFQVGNGSSTTRGNALTVTKGGQVTASQLVVTQSMSLSDTLVTLTNSSPFTLPVNYALIRINPSTGSSNNQMTLLAGSRVGQMVTILVTGSGGHTIFAMDNAAVNRTNLSADIQLLAGDALTLIWDGSAWIELSASINH